MAPNRSAEARARRAALLRRRNLTVAVCVTILVSIVGGTSWLLRSRTEQAALATDSRLLPAPPDAPDGPIGPNPTLYSDTADARSDINRSLSRARAEHKRVLLSFGGNWCGDCQVLEIYLHQPPNLQLLQQNFLLVHVNIGQYDRNLDLAEQYGVPLKKGVPALVVLAEDGRELFVQRTGEFERMAQVDPASVTAFLQQWKS